MTTRKALLVGATGLIGGFCLEALCNDPTYSEIIAIARKPFIKTHRNLRRVGETPKAKYLCTPVGKIQETIRAGLDRSFTQKVPEKPFGLPYEEVKFLL